MAEDLAGRVRIGRPPGSPMGTLRVALEGGSGAGKTTTARVLARRLGGPPPILEYFFYLDPSRGLSLPSFPPLDPARLRSENDIWARIDLLRESDMRRLASTRARSFDIVDTTVVSVLAYEYAKKRTGFLCDIRNLARDYIPLYNQGRLEEPDLWVFLMPGLEELRRRIDAKGGTRQLLEMDHAIVEADALRNVFRARYLMPENQVLIDNSRLSVAQSIQKIVAFLSRPRNVARVGTPLKSLLRDLASGNLVLDEPYGARVISSRRGRSK